VTLHWYDIAPEDATNIVLYKRVDIRAPRNEMGEPCPWPWEPQQLVGVPMGQYHCGYCGGMQVAGVPHLDWSALDIWRMEMQCVCPHKPEDHHPSGGCAVAECECGRQLGRSWSDAQFLRED
jgi:hypothetical protein